MRLNSNTQCYFGIFAQQLWQVGRGICTCTLDRDNLQETRVNSGQMLISRKSSQPFVSGFSYSVSTRPEENQSGLVSGLRRPSWVFCLHNKSSAEETMSLNNAFDNGPSTLEGRSQSRCSFPARKYSRSARVDMLFGSFRMLRYSTAIAATQFSDWMLEDVRWRHKIDEKGILTS